MFEKKRKEKGPCKLPLPFAIPLRLYLGVTKPTRITIFGTEFAGEVIEAGTIKAIIDRCYLLEQIIEAHRYVEIDQEKGNIVITIAA